MLFILLYFLHRKKRKVAKYFGKTTHKSCQRLPVTKEALHSNLFGRSRRLKYSP